MRWAYLCFLQRLSERLAVEPRRVGVTPVSAVYRHFGFDLRLSVASDAGSALTWLALWSYRHFGPPSGFRP